MNQNEQIFRDISLPANQWDRAYVFHDPSFPLGSNCSVHARPRSSNCRVLLFSVPTASIPLVVEIIGTAFRTGFPQAVLPPSTNLYPGDIRCLSPVITLRNLPGPMVGPSDSIGCRLSEILSDPARPTSVHHLPFASSSSIILSCNVSAVTAFGTTSFPPRPYK